MSKSVKAALFANGAIAIAKGLAAFYRFSIRDAEAIHSSADCGKSSIGFIRGETSLQEVERNHTPFWSRKSKFLWSFVVAVVLFMLGGLYSLYEGIHRIQDPNRLKIPLLILGIIIFAIALESSALRIALKESNSTLRNML